MKRLLGMTMATILCTCCLGLAACGGSGSESATSAGSASSSAATVSSANDASSSSSAASTEISPELKALSEKYIPVCDRMVALLEQAKEAGGYEAVMSEWEATKAEFDALSTEMNQWISKGNIGELSDADLSYMGDVVIPKYGEATSASIEILKY